MAHSLDQKLELELPSNRKLRYGNIKRMKTIGFGGKPRYSFLGKIVRNGQMRDFNLWGGILTENLSQGLARDIFSDMMLRIDAAGIPIILHVHDEVVCEVPEKDSEMALAKILEIMHTPPDWIPNIPVAAEGHILDLYSK
jgi:DNA polymerase